MAAPNVTLYDNLLQDLYSTERLQDMVHSESPILERLAKSSDLTGRGFVFSWKYGGNEAVTDTIAHSQAALQGTQAVDGRLTRKTLLAVSRIDCELLDVAFENRGAFVDAMDEEVGHIEKSFACNLASMVFANGGGAIGQISATSNVATATITLADIRDAHKFRPGQILQADTTDGTPVGAAVHAGTCTVAYVDYDTGEITATGNWNAGIGAIAATNYLFPYGRFAAGWAGFEAYCPATAPTSGDSFYGIDRSVSPTLLAGHRVTAGGGTVEDSLIDALTKAPPNIKPKQLVMNPYRIGILLRENAGKATYIRTDNSGNAMGANKLTIVTPGFGAPLEILSDPYCQKNVAWFVDLADWKVKGSKSGYVHIQKNKETGYMWFPVSDQNQIEMRMASYANMYCRNPANIMRLGF